MNPSLTITIDDKNKATVESTGMVTVGAKVDLRIVGLPSDIPNWGADDHYYGPSIRFRIVSQDGKDLARYPLERRTDDSYGDVWSTSGSDYVTATTRSLNLNTHQMRKAFEGVAYSSSLEFGIIIDSDVDDAQYAVGKIRVKNWRMASIDDPTVLPDWRETLHGLSVRIGEMKSVEARARASAQSAASAAAAASASASNASGALSLCHAVVATANNISNTAVEAVSQCSGILTSTNAAKDAAVAARQGAEGAAEEARRLIDHAPRIGANGRWYIWNVTTGDYRDTGWAATGDHNFLLGRTFTRPTTAKGWYELIAYIITEMGGNIDTDGITPGTAPSRVNITADDGSPRGISITQNADGEYTMEVL